MGEHQVCISGARITEFESKIEAKLDKLSEVIQHMQLSLSDKITSQSERHMEEIHKLDLLARDINSLAKENKHDIDGLGSKIRETDVRVTKIENEQAQFAVVKKIVFSLPVLIGIIEAARRIWG